MPAVAWALALSVHQRPQGEVYGQGYRNSLSISRLPRALRHYTLQSRYIAFESLHGLPGIRH
jgi:hypothetical protein